MTDFPLRTLVTAAPRTVEGNQPLQLEEIDTDIVNYSASTAAALETELARIGLSLALGGKTTIGRTTLLRHWPANAWSVGPALPDIPQLRSCEIGHGICVLRLQGRHALDLLAAHASADLHAPLVLQAATARCRIAHFNATIWWPNAQDVQMAVDRSLAQSFADHLTEMNRRWVALQSPHSSKLTFRE